MELLPQLSKEDLKVHRTRCGLGGRMGRSGGGMGEVMTGVEGIDSYG